MRAKLSQAKGHTGADPEDATNTGPRTSSGYPKKPLVRLQANAKQPKIGKVVDDAMGALERDNPSLKGVLPRITRGLALDKDRLANSSISSAPSDRRDAANRSNDVLGRVYEYFLRQFASAEGKNGGQFYTPDASCACWSRCSSPKAACTTACGSGGMFVQSEKFVVDTADAWATSPFTGRKATRRRGAGEDESRHSRHRRQFRPRNADTFARICTKTCKAISLSPIRPSTIPT